MVSIPLKCAALPDVEVADEQDDEEHEHLDQQEPHRDAAGRGSAEIDRGPRNQEHGLDVEHDEEHRHEIELDGEPLMGAAEGRHPALVRLVFDVGGPARPEEMRPYDHRQTRDDGQTEEHEERDVGLHRAREIIHLWVAGSYIDPSCPSSPTAGFGAWQKSIA